MQKTILITYAVPREGLKELEKDFNIIYPNKTAFTREEIKELIPNADAVMSIFTTPFDKELIEAGKNLKLISNYGVGFNNIDLKTASENNIVVCNTPYSVTEPTAEMALGLLLDVTRRITECDRKLRSSEGLQWGTMRNLGYSLVGKTLGIVGMGRIGQAFAVRAKACGMNIVYYNRRRVNPAIEDQLQAEYVSKEDLFKRSDVVSLNCPYTPETHHLINKDTLSMMKKNAYVINTARGIIVNEEDIVEALENEVIAGAGLDVFENEPNIHSKLLAMDNVVLAPHNGTGTVETRIDIAEEATQNILHFFNNEMDLITRVN